MPINSKRKRYYYVEKAGLGRVTVAMSLYDCQLYIRGAEQSGGTGYTIRSLAHTNYQPQDNA